MRIGHISALYPPYTIGGAEQVAKVVVDAQLAMGWFVQVLTLAPPTPTPTPHPTPSTPDHVTQIPLKNLYWPYDRQAAPRPAWQRLLWHGLDTHNPWMCHQVVQWVKQHRFDVVMTHNLQGFSTAVWSALADLGVRVVHFLHDAALVCPKTTLFQHGRACGLQDQRCRSCRWITQPRFAHTRSIDGVIGVSQTILDLHKAHGLFEHAKSLVSYNTLSDDQIGLSIPPMPPDSPLVLGFLGRLDEAKGIDLLLDAAQILSNKGLKVRLLLAGRAAPEDKIRWQQQYQNVDAHYLGYIDPTTLWSQVHALVMPSRGMESLGMGLIEAASQGRTTLISRHMGAVELLEEGVSGSSFERHQVDDLVALIIQLNEQKAWQRMGLAAYQRIQTLTMPTRLKQLHEWLQNL